MAAKAAISSNQTASLELLRVGMLAITLQLVRVETGGPVFPGPRRVTQMGGSTCCSITRAYSKVTKQQMTRSEKLLSSYLSPDGV
jgi:hypothetical protein